jgi:hypothetical protein
MSVQSDLSAAETRRTLLLYCPYDRKVTRHVRRGPGSELTCLECGRKLEASAPTERTWEGDPVYSQRTAAITPIGEPLRASRTASRRPAQRPRANRIRLGLVALVLAIGVLAAANVISRVLAPTSPTAPPPAAEVAQPAPVPPAATALRVAHTDGLGAYLRRTPNLDDRLRAWADGTSLTVVGPDATANGIEWKQVQDPAGNRGWIPAQYTSPE